MAHTTGTWPREVYEAQARSVAACATCAAGVAPSRCQFRRALRCFDEPTVLDFLRLELSIPRDMDETNAFVVRSGQLPASHLPMPRIEAESIFGTIVYVASIDCTDGPDPFGWLWPFHHNRLTAPVTLCELAARNALADVIAWLFCAPERVARIGAVLTHAFPATLRGAIYGRHVAIVDTLLVSPVFLELMSPVAQQAVLDEALCRSDDVGVWDMLVAHGANVAAVDDTHVVAGVGRFQVFMPGPVDAQLRSAVCRHSQGVRDRGLREDVVVRPDVLIAAAVSGDADAVATFLSKGFADVDARGADGHTALLACAAVRDTHHEANRRVVRCLLQAGADATLRNTEGCTALHAAVANSNLACVEALLDYTVATSGTEAVHNDVRALVLGYQARDGGGGAGWQRRLVPLPGHRWADQSPQHVLAVLLARGACANAYAEMVRTNQVVSEVCGDPSCCLRQTKRKRGASKNGNGTGLCGS